MITRTLTLFPDRLLAGFVPTSERRSRLLGMVDRLNLAPFRYAYVSAAASGPIDRVEVYRTPFDGREYYTVNAFLKDEVVPSRPRFAYYANADGTGTRTTLIKARLVAISEAIERWAYYTTVRSPQRDYYGFEVDSSSNGMAAFPGLTSRRAREHAWREAIERFVLFSWWEGRLNARVEDMPGATGKVLRIDNPYTPHEVVVTFKEVADAPSPCHVYGYAAAETLDAAIESARIEMVRHEWVLRRFLDDNPCPHLGLSQVGNLLEKRSLFFATRDGHRLFNERLGVAPWLPQSRMRVVYDGPIYGAWDDFATVWRTVIAPPSEAFRSDRYDYFFW